WSAVWFLQELVQGTLVSKFLPVANRESLLEPFEARQSPSCGEVQVCSWCSPPECSVQVQVRAPAGQSFF
ncbi:hypothetical protein NDU88_010655, partial [Pleurodeles waltl]